jgi:hypothetical protein
VIFTKRLFGDRQRLLVVGAFRAEGDTSTKFYLSFLDDESRPDAALVQALNDGASRIVVVEVFVSISNNTALRFREQILKRLEADGYRMENIGLAWMEFREPQPAEKV